MLFFPHHRGAFSSEVACRKFQESTKAPFFRAGATGTAMRHMANFAPVMGCASQRPGSTATVGWGNMEGLRAQGKSARKGESQKRRHQTSRHAQRSSMTAVRAHSGRHGVARASRGMTGCGVTGVQGATEAGGA